MRTLVLSLTLSAAIGLAALTPGEASAFSRWSYYNPPAYYAQSYYSPGAYYTTSTFGGYTTVAPVVNSYYYAPSYSVPAYNLAPIAPYDYRPVYSGPQYFQGYAPPRMWIYP